MSSCFVVPQRTHAQAQAVVVVEDKSSTSLLDLAKNTITAAATVAAKASLYALVFDKYVLEPIAFVTSGRLIQAMTGSIVSFINGQANGTGVPQYVQNIQGNLRTVGDTQAFAFLAQFGRNSDSPFAASIYSSLRTQYLQQTSLAGFFAANRNTLPQYSANPSAFLAGDWSQGGVAAWFALTTQDQNNPYMLHYRAQNELYTMVQNQISAREQELAWGQGYLSWCGPSSNKLDASDALTGPYDPNSLNPSDAAMGPQLPAGSPGAVSPGDPCIQSDGTPGLIQTPASTIRGTFDRYIGLNADKVAAMGNTSAQIDSILGNFVNVLNTANFAVQLIGGTGGPGGLAGASRPYGTSGATWISQQASTGYYGLTASAIRGSGGSVPVEGVNQIESVPTTSTNVTAYTAAWNTISAAASTAATNVGALLNSCSSDAAIVSNAQNALQGEIAPIFSKVLLASSTIASIQTTPISDSALADAVQQSFTTGAATAGSSNTLVVSGGTYVDQMNLLSTNALALTSSCTKP